MTSPTSEEVANVLRQRLWIDDSDTIAGMLDAAGEVLLLLFPREQSNNADAVFTIELDGEHSSLHSQAFRGGDPADLLWRAIAVLWAEREALVDCPIHNAEQSGALTNAFDVGREIGYRAAKAEKGAAVPLPEGRSEQDQGGGDPALGAETFRIAVGWQKRCGKAEAEVERLRADVFRPGVMRCAKCQFRLIRNVLYAQTGDIGVGTSETEPCPNGCGPLWPVTWKDECKEADRCWDQQVERAVKAEADLSAALLRIKALETENEALLAVEEAARNLPRETPAPGGAGTEHPFMIAAAHVWDNDRALGQLDKLRSLPSAQGETKPETALVHGVDFNIPNPSAGATAALASRIDVEPGCDHDNIPAPGEIRVINGKWMRFIERELEGDKWEVLGPAPDAAALVEGE